jgi:hypothetical protein
VNRSLTVPHISIAYTAPVQVIVDVDTTRVTRVVVIDEDVTLDRNGYWDNHDTVECCTLQRAAAGYAVAETSPWPGWDVRW